MNNRKVSVNKAELDEIINGLKEVEKRLGELSK